MEVPRMEEALSVPRMEEAEKVESHITSAAAFVEGGIQEACDDACSICLEEFCDSDPSTVTSCKHEFHLQCILEWCQRSSQCPMCWQAISLKDPTSQELLEAVERERNFRFTPSRNATIFHHPTLGNFELQHVPMGTNDPELEERIIQHLAAAAAMGRSHHFSRREGQRSRSSANGRPHFLVFSTHPNAPSTGLVSGSPAQVGGETESAPITLASPSIPLTTTGNEASHQIRELRSVQTDRTLAMASGSAVIRTDRQGTSFNTRSSSRSSSPNQDRAGPSEFQSLSDNLKSRFNAMSMRYKDSISKSTRGWKERLFSRSSSGADLSSEVRREVNAGIASVTRMMERPESIEDSTTNRASVADRLDGHSVTEQSNPNEVENRGENPLNDSNMPSSCAASSAST